MTIFFTADTHFGHANVIDYAHRPFRDVDEMDREMIRRWNDVVGDKDMIYHLGDVALCPEGRALALVSALRGRKILVFGNHDKRLRKNKAFLSLFEETRDFMEIIVQDASVKGGQHIVLLHYAMRIWNKSHYGSWQLYGHSHGSLPDDPHARSLDVGVDCWDYAPVSYETLRDRMQKKLWQPIDHHQRREER